MPWKRRVGASTIVVGGLVFVVALALVPYYKFGFSARPGPITLWDLSTREPLVLTLVGAAAIALAAMSLFADAMSPLLLATCCSFYLFGRVFPIGAVTYRLFEAGVWVATGASAAMSLGGVLALMGRRSSRPFARPS